MFATSKSSVGKSETLIQPVDFHKQNLSLLAKASMHSLRQYIALCNTKSLLDCHRGADLKQSVIGRSPSRGQIKERD